MSCCGSCGDARLQVPGMRLTSFRLTGSLSCGAAPVVQDMAEPLSQQLQVMIKIYIGGSDAPNAKNTLMTATIIASRLRPPWPAAVMRNTSCCACSESSLVKAPWSEMS